MGCRARTLDRRFRPACHFNQHLQSFDDRLMPDAAAPDRAEALLVMGDAAVSCGDAEGGGPVAVIAAGLDAAKFEAGVRGHQSIEE